MNKPAIEGGNPVRKNFLVFGRPDIRDDEIKEVVDTLHSGWLSTGPKVKQFEENFKEYIGSKYAVATSSCTAGLFLALNCLGLEEEDEIITSPLTFPATGNAILLHRLKPVFVDVDIKTGCIDPEEIEKAINPKTRAIIPVHIYGRPCDMSAITEIAQKHHISVIEDAAHALGAIYKGKKIGNNGDFAVFSFYVTKNITTGEGGMVTTNDKKWEKIYLYTRQGLSSDAWTRFQEIETGFYEAVSPGFKFNMTDIQASIGIHQLRRYEENLNIRAKWTKIYTNAFKDIPEIILPDDSLPEKSRHSRHLYTIFLDIDQLKITRNEFAEAMKRENIGVGIHFIPLHLHKFYRESFGYKRGNFPNSEWIGDRTLSLPLSSNLEEGDIEDVISAVMKIIKYYRR